MNTLVQGLVELLEQFPVFFDVFNNLHKAIQHLYTDLTAHRNIYKKLAIQYIFYN